MLKKDTDSKIPEDNQVALKVLTFKEEKTEIRAAFIPKGHIINTVVL